MNYEMVTKWVFEIPDTLLVVGWTLVLLAFIFLRRFPATGSVVLGIGGASIVAAVVCAAYGTVKYG